MTTRGGLLGLYAQTAVHPGAGTALGSVDLPVQRERHTHWPNAAGSALKGILRDACRERLVRVKSLRDEPPDPADPNKKPRTRRDLANEEQELTDVFGPPTGAASEAAGALSVTDARLLAFPVRSLKGVFAWVSCPMALDRLHRDADLVGLTVPWAVPKVEGTEALVSASGCNCLLGTTLVLEEFEFTKAAKGDAAECARWVAANLLPAAGKNGQATAYARTVERFPAQLVILADDWFTHFARHATEVVARVGLDPNTKTVKQGALFYQEFLPAETLLYAVVLANPARARSAGGADKGAEAILTALTGALPPVLQVGGDETTGKGYCATRFAGAGGAT
jgi:CRISPR-associated protein Cmr4